MYDVLHTSNFLFYNLSEAPVSTSVFNVPLQNIIACQQLYRIQLCLLDMYKCAAVAESLGKCLKCLCGIHMGQPLTLLTK